MRSKPTTKPPNVVPQYCPAIKGTGPSFIRQYVGFLVYVWTVDGHGFWAYPLSVQNGVLYGYIWRTTYYEYTQFNISMVYPNTQWGYGSLNLIQSFNLMREL